MRNFILLLIAGMLFGSANDAALVFLTIFPGARAVGMAAAFTAVADDATATYYNPGAMGFFNVTEVALQHSNWLPELWKGMYYEFLGFIKPLPPYGRIGGHIIYLTTGETQAVDEQGRVITAFKNFDFAITLSYGTLLRESFGVGLNAKIIYSFLAPDWLVRKFFAVSGGSALTYAFDFGFLYKTPLKGLNIGGSLLNIGPGVSYTEEAGSEDPLPYTLKTGIAYTPFNSEAHRLTGSVEITKIVVNLLEDWKDRGPDYVYRDAWKHVGTEYVYYNFLSARIGYFMDEIGQREGFTFGGGLYFKSFNFDVGVDSRIYSFRTENYRFSLGYRF